MTTAQKKEIPGLQPLGNLDDYEVADHDTDIRGWDVVGAAGKRIGEVEELIVDLEQMRVRYLRVDADKELFAEKEYPKLLIPIGTAQLDHESRKVVVPTILEVDIHRSPKYAGGPITREQEWEACRFTVSDTSAITDDNFYTHEHFDERRAFAKPPVRDARTTNIAADSSSVIRRRQAGSDRAGR